MIAAVNEVADAGYHPNGRDSRKELLDFGRIARITSQTVWNLQAAFAGIAPILVDTIDPSTRCTPAAPRSRARPCTGFTEFADGDDPAPEASDLIIVAGRPSMGKTTFCMNIAENAVIQAEQPVAIFSMEMPGEQLAMRMISSLSMVELGKIRTGALTDADWPRIFGRGADQRA